MTVWSSRGRRRRRCGPSRRCPRARSGGDRAHERLVAVAQVRVHHVEVALVDRHVDRLADRAARVVQVRRHVGELHEVLEVLERGVAAAVVEVVDERRAVVGREHRVRAADLDAVRRVARVLGVLARARSPDDLAAQAAREAHALAVDVRAGGAEQRRAPPGSRGSRCPTSSRIVSALCSMSARPSSSRHLERRQRPGEERDALDDVRDGARGLPRGAAAAARRPGSSRSCGPPRGRRRRRCAAGVARRRSSGRRDRAPDAAGSATTRGQVRYGAVSCGNAIAATNMLLEARLDRGLDLLDACGRPSSISARAARRQQRDARPGAGRVADRA